MPAKMLVDVPWRICAWCRSHRLLSALLLVIALQQFVIARAYYLLREREVVDDARTLLMELYQKHKSEHRSLR